MRKRFHSNPADLLGQAEIYPPKVHLPGQVEPKFEIAWNSFHQNFLSGVPVLFQSGRLPAGEPPQDVFRECIVERRMPGRGVLAAFLLYSAAIIFPWPNLPAAPRKNPAFENTELTWSGPIEDLPLLNIAKQKSKSPAKSPEDAPAAPDAFHPRQRISTDPVDPNHPRQTLINPAAPDMAPKYLPDLPNIVQVAAAQAPSRPHLEINEKSLANLRPKEAKHHATTDATPMDLPNMEQNTAQLSIAANPNGPARPHLEINAGSAPRMAENRQTGDAAPAPELAPSSTTGSSQGGTLIALSASPAPPAPVVNVPQGNLAARVSISPEGKPGGNGGGASGGGASGNGSVGVSISGGNPKPGTTASGLGGSNKLILPKAVSPLKKPDSLTSAEDPIERTGPPNFALLGPNAKPEAIFSTRRVYALTVNMPNLNSVTGSWKINFSEMQLGGPHHGGEVSSPVPIRKVDPKYPQDLKADFIEGQVVLYGVIRKDGTVDSIQVVKGVDPQLDANSVAAFGQWKFEPALKNGQPVDLEAIVYIPFRAPDRQ